MDRATGEGRVSQMSDNLRDRIKEEVLDGILSMFSEDDSVEMAAGYITDAVIRELGWQRIVDYCTEQAAIGWRDVGTADEAMGRNIVAEVVLTILEGTDDE